MFESLDGRRAGPEAKVVDLLDQAAQDLNSNRRIEATARAALLSSIGIGYHGTGRYERAEALLSEALDLYRRALGERAPEVAETCFKLGCAVQRRGDYLRAQELLERAYHMQRERSGEASLEAALTLDRLGAVVWLQGDTPRGEDLLMRALEIHRRLLGERHPRIVMSLQRLATLVSSKGERERAEGLFLEALAMARQIGPEDSLDVALVQEKLADHYIAVAAFDKAEPLLREIAKTVERQLGPDHPDLASALYNQARLLKDLVRCQEASGPARRALQIRRRAYPRVHKEVAESLALVGAVALGLGDLNQGEGYFQEALEIQSEIHGKRSAPVASLLNMQADLAEWRGQFDEAIEGRQKALEMLRALGMEERSLAARTLVDLGHLRHKRGEDAEAVPLVRKGLELFRRIEGPRGQSVFWAEYILGTALLAAGDDPVEAQRVLRDSYRGMKEILGARSYLVGVAAARLGWHLSDRGNFSEAEPLLMEALLVLGGTRPGDHAELRKTEARLGLCLVRLGRFADAESFLKGSRVAPGGGGRDCLEALIALYEAWGRPETSEEFRTQLSLLGSAARPPAAFQAAESGAVVDLPHTLRSEPFRGGKEGVQHALSYWEVRRWDADYAREPTFSKVSAKDLTALALPRGLLLPEAAYRWRVLHVGSDRSAPAFLAEQAFLTGPYPFKILRIDTSARFNRDVVADPDDPENDSFDGDEKSLLLVDGFDGVSATNDLVQGLPLDRKVLVHELDSYSEPNTLQLTSEDLDPVRIEVPPRRYVALRFLLSGGNGDSVVPADFKYRGGAVDRHMVPCDDWFHDNLSDSQGGLQKGLTPVRNGMDRMYLGRFEDRNDPALFELVVATRPDAELEAVVLLPEEGLFSGRYTRFNLFAVTAIEERE
ncbi:MAG: tetratricopeptide repeat protein, partial [Thermoanaerobaculia bacterium]